jgi:hypothetical protein
MKQAILFLILLTLFSACHKEPQKEIVSCTTTGPYDFLNNYTFGTINTDTFVQKYQQVWKDLFMEKNQVSQSWFDNHITLIQSDTGHYNDGATYAICYKVHVDWAVTYQCDQFIIKIDSSADEFAAYPRNRYLTEDEINEIIANSAFSSQLSKVVAVPGLRFSSYEEALDYLIKAGNVNTLCGTAMSLDKNGHIQLSASGKYKNKVNSCIFAILDLENGKTNISDGPCYIF